MKFLLAHALRSEAGLIKQHYPQAQTLSKFAGIDLISLSSRLDLLRTGMGLNHVRSALSQLSDLETYSGIIHFGVSGSLANELEIQQIIQGKQFLCDGKATLTPPLIQTSLIKDICEISFFTSITQITDEVSRQAAKSCGGDAVDMESYAVAEYCIQTNTPLLSLRCISDRAGASTSEDFKTHYKGASGKLQTFILEQIVKELKFPA